LEGFLNCHWWWWVLFLALKQQLPFVVAQLLANTHSAVFLQFLIVRPGFIYNMNKYFLHQNAALSKGTIFNLQTISATPCSTYRRFR